MKKILSLFAAFLALASISYSKTINLETVPSDLSVKKNDKIVLKLNANPTTGYIWQIDIQNPKDNDVLTNTNKEYKVANKKLIGGSGTYIYTIKAQNKGVSAVSGNYLRPWEQVEPLKSFKVNVTVK